MNVYVSRFIVSRGDSGVGLKRDGEIDVVLDKTLSDRGRAEITTVLDFKRQEDTRIVDMGVRTKTWTGGLSPRDQRKVH